MTILKDDQIQAVHKWTLDKPLQSLCCFGLMITCLTNGPYNGILNFSET